MVAVVMASGTRSLAALLVIACTAYALTPLASVNSTGTSVRDHVLLAVLLVLFVATISVCVWAAAREHAISQGKWLLVAGQYSAVALWGVFGSAWSVLPAVAAGAGLLVWPARTGYLVCAITASITVYLAVREFGFGANTLEIVGRSVIVLVVFVALAAALSLRRQLEATTHRTTRLALATGQDRIYRDLHDILGRSLTVIAVQSDTAATMVDSDPTGAREQMQRVNTAAREAISDMRSIVRGHRHAGLTGEVRLARDLLTATGVDVDVDDELPALPERVDEAFGWVVRESVTNILRHGESTEASISVTRSPAGSHIEVRNDHRDRSAGNTGSGIDGMRDRVAALGGTLHTRRESGSFIVEAHVPEAEEEE